MKFSEAKQKLKDLAKGDYHSLRYTETISHTGETIVLCEVYINGHSSRSDGTWESAIAAMERQINDQQDPEYEGQPV